MRRSTSAPPLRAFGRTQELAASRTASKTKVVSPTGRISFAKIAEPMEVPDLLDLQIDSFDWLIGNEAWRDRVATALDQGRTDINTKSGLEEIFEEISPIEDFSGTMSLSFRDHRFEPPKNTVDECKERDVTYAAPLFVTAEFMNNETGEIKSQTVFMGDFPLMTDKGTFVINGTERVVVSQLVRSPGVYFEQTTDKTSDKDIFTCKMHPVARRVARVRNRQAGHGRRPPGPQAQAERHRAAQGARLDRRPDPGAVRRVRVDAAHPGEGPHHHPGRGAAGHLPQAASRASRRPARPPRHCWRTTTSTRSATTWPRSAVTRSTRSWVWSCRSIGRC